MPLTEQIRYGGPALQYLNAVLPERRDFVQGWVDAVESVEADTFPIDDPQNVGSALELRISLDVAQYPGNMEVFSCLPPQYCQDIIEAAGFKRDMADAHPETVDPLLWSWIRDEKPHVYDRTQVRSLLDCYAAAGAGYFAHKLNMRTVDERRTFFMEHYPSIAGNRKLPASVWQGLTQMWQLYVADGRDLFEELGKEAASSPVMARGFATADMVVGQTIVDVKAQRKPADKMRETFDQVLCYALLDRYDRFSVNSIAAYFGWHATMVKADLADIIASSSRGKPPDIDELRDGFEKAIIDDLKRAAHYKGQIS